MSLDIQGVSDSLLQHYKTEEQTLEQLLILEKQFRQHDVLMKAELLVQKELAARLWVLSQRYILIASTGPCCRFPEIYAGPAEEAILTEFCDKLKTLRNSNCHISASVRELRKSCRIFNQLCSQLDMKIESPFIIGDTYHKPLAYFIELVSDLFKYFHAWVLKLQFNSHLIDPYKSEGIEYYKTLTEPSEDFDEYLNVGLTYCKCLRPKSVG